MKFILKLILSFCAEGIDPSFDENYCVEHMVQCVVKEENSFYDCTDYWEGKENELY